jgi:transposase-like protein
MATGNGTTPTTTTAALLDAPDFLRELVRTTLQTLLEEELTAHLGAVRYERTEARTGYRNGAKPRTLATRVGKIELRVPQDRAGTFSPELFARYQRSEQALVLSLMEMYVQGVSTRKVSAITEALCGTSFSKSQVSALTTRLDVELTAWRERPLEQAYPYLTVDARYEHVRLDGRVVSQGVLIASGIRVDGYREILAVSVADTESEATYQDLFRDLKQRGVSGVELVTSDDHPGLRAAIGRHFQGASWQRCQVHFSRNLLGHVGHRHRATLAADLKALFGAASAQQARTLAGEIAARWQERHPTVAAAVEDDLEECLSCYAFPAGHHARLRTTNGLERLNQELKRRTRVVRIFPDRASLLRLVTALAREYSDEWISGRRSLDMEARAEPDAGAVAPALAQAAA